MKRLRQIAAANLLLGLLTSAASFLNAAAPAAYPPLVSMQSAALHLRGRVADSSRAVIQAASVRIHRGADVIAVTVTNATGDFDAALDPGEYEIEITAPGFKPFTQKVRVAAGMSPLSITLALAGIEAKVDVIDVAGRDVTIDSDAALGAQTIAGDQLADLPDDEVDLAVYLLRLAGTSGAAGAQAVFVIDGFNGGRLPPKDQIQQIIIDNNPFSADGNGGARITILTRPGTSAWTGQFGGNMNSSAFNAATPESLTKPQRKTKTFNSTLGGAIIPKILTTTFTGQYSQTDAEGNAIRAVLPSGLSVNQGVLSPNTRRNGGVRGQLYLSKNNTLNFNTLYASTNAKNQGVGGFNLAERAFNSSGRTWQIQFSELAIMTASVVNELRFQAAENDQKNASVTNAIAINVNGAFNSGGGQNNTDTRNRTYQLGDTLRWRVGPKLNVQTGFEGNYERRRSLSQSNLLGAYTFASLDDYLAGRPQTFTQSVGNPLVNAHQTDFTGFIQADWRVAPIVTLGFGARYIAQSNLHDRNNLGPTASIGIQAARGTVIRAGARLSYQNFSLNNTETILRNSGAGAQTIVSIAFPTYVPGQAPPEAAQASSGSGGSIYLRSATLQAPYNINSQVGVEQALPGGWRISASVDSTRGAQLIRTRNINAPYPGTALSADLRSRLSAPDAAVRNAARAEVDRLRPLFPTTGNIYQFESSAAAFSKNFTLRLYTPPAGLPGTPGTLYLGHFGFGGSFAYTRGYSEDDLGIAPNQYDFHQEWARSASDQRNRIQAQFQVRPTATVGLMTFNITYGSGRPYSLSTGRDNNGDQSSADRPFGVGRNTLTTPSSYNIDLTWNKIRTLRRGTRTSAPATNAETQAGGVAQTGGGTQVGRVNFSGPRLTWTFTVRNLLNNTQVRAVSGIQTSPLFGRAIVFAPGRAITAGLTFAF